VFKVAFSAPPGSSLPPQVPKGLTEAMETAATSAVVELMAAYGVTIQATDALSIPDLAALDLVRFTAQQLTGTATLGASAAILKRTNGGATTGRDWIAELANQFVGRWKLKLLRAKFELWSLAPVATKGRLLVTGISAPETTPLSFVDGQGGAVALWMELDINGEVKAGAPAVAPPPPAPPPAEVPATDAEIPNEGDIILF
jgi:hypothetical protein